MQTSGRAVAAASPQSAVRRAVRVVPADGDAVEVVDGALPDGVEVATHVALDPRLHERLPRVVGDDPLGARPRPREAHLGEDPVLALGHVDDVEEARPAVVGAGAVALHEELVAATEREDGAVVAEPSAERVGEARVGVVEAAVDHHLAAVVLPRRVGDPLLAQRAVKAHAVDDEVVGAVAERLARGAEKLDLLLVVVVVVVVVVDDDPADAADGRVEVDGAVVLLRH